MAKCRLYSSIEMERLMGRTRAKHGFIGYRFIREDTNRVNFTSLDEVIALNKYDMQLKTVLYPKVMFIENALKSYVVEALLADSKSENFDVIYNKSLTAYRNHTPGSRS